jgi:hypothetical protein
MYRRTRYHRSRVRKPVSSGEDGLSRDWLRIPAAFSHEQIARLCYIERQGPIGG